MESLVQIALYHFAVSQDGLPHGRSRRSWRGEQRLDKTAGLGGVELNLVVLSNNPAGHFTRVRGNEFGQRTALDGGGSPEKLLVRRRYPGDEALAFRFFQGCRHTKYVCLCGTQIKN